MNLQMSYISKVELSHTRCLRYRMNGGGLCSRITFVYVAYWTIISSKLDKIQI